MGTIYKSYEGETKIMEMYDRFQRSLAMDFDELMVNTHYGPTHVLVTGPDEGLPVVVTHGGNSIAPQALRGLLPFLNEKRYRIYAPDTIGHPGKTAQVRLSPRDHSYGLWLNDLLDEIGLEKAAFIGGSYGAGIILKLAAYAPQRVNKMALFVPSGIVPVPMSSMMFNIGFPYLRYLIRPTRQNMMRAIHWMGNGFEEDELELIEAVFNYVRVESEMPRPVTETELQNFTAPTMVIAAEKDLMFPGEEVVRRAKEIFSNLRWVECLKGGSHASPSPDKGYISRRIMEFLEAS